MEELILYMAKALVTDKEAVKLTDGGMQDDVQVYNLTVSEEDKGFVIGRQGKVAKALRSVARAAANREGKKVHIEIL